MNDEKMYTKYWLTASESLPRNIHAKLTDHPDMASAVYLGNEATNRNTVHAI